MHTLPIQLHTVNEVSIRGFFAYGKALVILWMNKSRQRRQLARLDPRLLADVGITAEQARIEVEKDFWR